MNIFEVIQLDERSIAGLPGWSLTRRGRRWVATDPEGTVRASGRIPGNVEAQAQQYAARAARATPTSDTDTPRSSQPAANDADGARRPDGRIEPTLSRDGSTPSQSRNPSPPDGELRADVRPGTPTTDSLSRGEARRLARTGSITRGGVTYTRSMIARADAEAARLGRAVDPDLRADDRSTPSNDRNPQAPDADDTPDGWGKKLWAKLGGRILKTLNALFGAKVGLLINSAINASAAEDALDAYMRAIINDANDVEEANRQAFVDGIENGNFTPGVARAYLETVERFNQLFVEAVIGIVLAGGWTAFILLTGFSIGTGFVGAVLSLVAGGAFVVGGSLALYQLFEAVGINNWFEQNVTGQLMHPAAMLGLAFVIDGSQETIGSSLAWLRIGDWSATDLVTDSIMYEETQGTVSSNQAKELVKDLIKSDPKMLDAYNQGKDEAKRIMQSGGDEEDSD